jgi:ABC-type methionine transport system permease subunit
LVGRLLVAGRTATASVPGLGGLGRRDEASWDWGQKACLSVVVVVVVVVLVVFVTEYNRAGVDVI